jgi:hypothetical protein
LQRKKNPETVLLGFCMDRLHASNTLSCKFDNAFVSIKQSILRRDEHAIGVCIEKDGIGVGHVEAYSPRVHSAIIQPVGNVMIKLPQLSLVTVLHDVVSTIGNFNDVLLHDSFI